MFYYILDSATHVAGYLSSRVSIDGSKTIYKFLEQKPDFGAAMNNEEARQAVKSEFWNGPTPENEDG